MSEVQAREIADTASVIVNGYAMLRDGSNSLEMYQLWATKSQTGFFVG